VAGPGEFFIKNCFSSSFFKNANKSLDVEKLGSITSKAVSSKNFENGRSREFQNQAPFEIKHLIEINVW